MQLVLKALITIGDLSNQIEAAMIVSTCLEMEEEDSPATVKEEKGTVENNSEAKEGSPEGRRVVRRRSAAS